MKHRPRFSIDRSAFVLIPKQPMFDWIMEVDPVPASLTLEDIRKDPDIFMVQQEKVETHVDADAWISKHWKPLFEHVLNDWYTDEKLWPKNRTVKMFREWFDVQFHSMIWDLEGAQITHEDWGDE